MNWFYLILFYLMMEGIINVVFYFLTVKLKSNENRVISISKGILERLFLVTGLIFALPQVIIAFSALKIGTRFQKDSKVSNDYFLIGNFISLLAALLYSQLAIILIN